MKIVIVGGGSTHWTPRLLCDFANTPSLQDAHVVLMDVHEPSLAPMLDVAAHISKCRPEIGLSVTGTTDLDAALDGAEFVITAFSVGGFDSMRFDLEIPAKYGIDQTVGDSVGPGGISRAMRSVPVLLEIARAVEHRAPDAWLLNVTNPLSALTRSVSRETNVRTVGLCNEMVGCKFVISLLLDADLRAIDPVVAGVNHLPLVTEMPIRSRDGDRDGFAELRDLLDDEDKQREPVWMAPMEAMHYTKVSEGPEWTKADVIAGNAVKLELFRQFGVLPGSHDVHVVEFFAALHKTDIFHYRLDGHMRDKQHDDDHVAEILASDELTSFPSGELVAELIDSLITNTALPIPVNLPNRGQVQNLPDDVIVECIGRAADGDVVPRDTAFVPSVLGEQLRRVAAAEELTVEAALTGDRTKVLEAMLADPVAGSLPYADVTTMTDELLAATSKWLPQFS